MAARQVQFEEVERSLAEFVSAAEQGDSLTILRNGRPVAQIIPMPPQPCAEEREPPRRRLMELMDRGLDLGGSWPGREELYDRDQSWHRG